MRRLQNDIGLLIAIFLLGVGLVMIFFPYNILDGKSLGSYKIHIKNYNDLGTFISGITGPFLSLAAFTLLFITYKSQKNELKETRTLLTAQGKTQQVQQFESTFFNLVNLYDSIVNSIDLTISTQKKDSHYDYVTLDSITKKGRDCFVTFYEGFKTAYKHEKLNYKSNPDLSEKDNELIIVQRAYFTFFRKHDYDLGHYFRNLYHIVKFINNAKIENKEMYASLIRAQLSSHELLVLFYNCLSPLGEKFYPLIPTFHFLKNIPLEDILHADHELMYTPAAFKK